MINTDEVYRERNAVVAALAKCFPAGVKKTAIEGWDLAWHNCVYIDLPTGQASWHFHDDDADLFVGLPPYEGEWDGHSTPEKYARLTALASQEGAQAGEAVKQWRPLANGTSAPWHDGMPPEMIACETRTLYTIPSALDDAVRAAVEGLERCWVGDHFKMLTPEEKQEVVGAFKVLRARKVGAA